ncbi:hypothetical protein PRZ48_013156 [Zasmidium cellare]|uniref:SnoaL-like domain-containing protein n=1 Tax=Zasmidium cellare TaxID=395010 RepID=A0ABR0E386_ZASCE|nr:hypothetical protein PRZ48_013156 [Zasmidium cellare]
MAIKKPLTADSKVQEPLALSKSATEEEIITHIESFVTSAIIAINTRHFDPSLPPCTSISQDVSMPGIGFRQAAKSRVEYVDGFRKLAASYPRFEIEPLKMESYVLLEAGYAEVYLTAQSFGGPTLATGLKRKAVGRHEFRRVDGVWLMVGETTFLGIGDGGAVFEM